ncbi:MAG: nuclear transport factor 2 family protein [Proteobacteria bacterium]|nr:nuclear transport factor 2 family protein [Pseudomonadota bacterium]
MSVITRADVEELFDYMANGQPEKFMDRLVEDIHWTVKGTHPLAGTFKSKQEYLDGAFNRLTAVLKGGIQLQLEAVYIDGLTAIVELKSFLTALNGMPYHNEYCWVIHFSEDKQITAITAYLDSALLKQVIEENELIRT